MMYGVIQNNGESENNIRLHKTEYTWLERGTEVAVQSKKLYLRVEPLI